MKILTAGSLFQYFTALTEKTDPLLRWWLAPSSTLKGRLLGPRRMRGRKTHSDKHKKTREYLEGSIIQTQMYLRKNLQP